MESLREKTVKLRRQHILQAAIDVFAERGFERATIKEIARAAGVSDGAIYNVFASKTALLEGMLAPLATELTEVGDAVPLAQRVRDRWTAFSPETLKILQVVLSEALVDEGLRALFYQRIMAPVLLARGGGGDAGPALDPLRQRALVGALVGLVVLRLLGDPVSCERWDEFPELLAGLFDASPEGAA